jgi:hypothetical protein
MFLRIDVNEIDPFYNLILYSMKVSDEKEGIDYF